MREDSGFASQAWGSAFPVTNKENVNAMRPGPVSGDDDGVGDLGSAAEGVVDGVRVMDRVDVLVADDVAIVTPEITAVALVLAVAREDIDAEEDMRALSELVTVAVDEKEYVAVADIEAEREADIVADLVTVQEFVHEFAEADPTRDAVANGDDDGVRTTEADGDTDVDAVDEDDASTAVLCIMHAIVTAIRDRTGKFIRRFIVSISLRGGGGPDKRFGPIPRGSGASLRR